MEHAWLNTVKPYLECPRFGECSVNCCPLDPKAESRPSLPEDAESECKARISTRKTIALKYGLPNRGMTEKELKRELSRICCDFRLKSCDLRTDVPSCKKMP